ncbi:acylneuraminate cytidylyltransferase family protein [Laspinema sp. D1]|uniref:Acylneuraminate cytidylyltransferase family protein n=1 Tax=Laspinema palackyanum D2a TaxID=2953684 RepID=A0ABT2MXB7_9CYAN|nr:acylneuraminate cytidylyltransferase family protein [Laspinema sp. D2a]
MKRICTICARGGSKGVENKNIRQIAGKPLIAYTLEQAQVSRLFEVIAVSSDSPEILDVAQCYGVNVLIQRPPELATDEAPKLPVIRHCVEETERIVNRRFDIVVDLDATSPLRLPEDIQGAVNLLESQNLGNIITGSPARRSPYFNLVELKDDGVVQLVKPPITAIVRRQDSPKCFDMNASIYVWQRDVVFNAPSVFNQDTRLFVMPESRSIDIDSELDFEMVEFMLKKRQGV